MSAGGSGVPHRRQTVICRCGKYQAGAHWALHSGCGQPLGAFREKQREQKRRGWDTTMVARRVWVTGVTVVTVYLALFLVVPLRLT